LAQVQSLGDGNRGVLYCSSAGTVLVLLFAIIQHFSIQPPTQPPSDRDKIISSLPASRQSNTVPVPYLHEALAGGCFCVYKYGFLEGKGASD